jgi:hypothetical protein
MRFILKKNYFLFKKKSKLKKIFYKGDKIQGGKINEIHLIKQFFYLINDFTLLYVRVSLVGEKRHPIF